MHKRLALLMIAENENIASNKAQNFMDKHKWHVWERYEIGGRWEGILSKESNIVKLVDCIDIIKSWQQTIVDAKKEEEDAKKWIPDYNMYGFCLIGAGCLYRQKFFYGCNVFNVETNNYEIPVIDIEKYYVVLIDMDH